MSPGAIRNFYILYIGAGAVATGGIISMAPGHAGDHRGTRCRASKTWPACLAPRRRSADGSRAADRARSVDGRRAGRQPAARVSAGAVAESWAGLVMAWPARRGAGRRLWLLVRDRLLATDRRNRLVVESDFRHDGGHAAADVPDFSGARQDDEGRYADGADDRRRGLHRGLQRRHDGAGLENRLSGRRDAQARSRSAF